jgi:hypothetical protein
MLGRLTSLEQLHLSAGVQIGWRFNWIIDHAVLIQTLQPLQKLKTIAFSRDTYNPGYSPRYYTSADFTDAYYENQHLKWRIREMNSILDPGYEDDNDLDSSVGSVSGGDADDRYDEYQQNEADMSIEGEDDGRTDIGEVANEDDTSEGTGGDGGAEEYSVQPDDEATERSNSKAWERQHARRMIIHAKPYFEIFPDLTHIYLGQLPIKCPKDLQCFIIDGERDSCKTWLAETFGKI